MKLRRVNGARHTQHSTAQRKLATGPATEQLQGYPRGLDLELQILQPPALNCSNVQVHPPLGFCGAGDSTKASSLSGKHSASWDTSSAPL